MMHPVCPRRPRAPRSPHRLRARFQPETLESRRLLSTAASTLPALAGVTATSSLTVEVAPSVTNPAPPSSALTPAQVKAAYSVPTNLTGANETIAIVDAYNDPTIASDLATFDAQYGLPAASLSVVNQNGGSTLPATDPGWSMEISLDVEWAHAIAPGAKIELVEANSTNLSDLLTAVNTAAKTANVVSMSWGSSEFNGETSYDSAFNVPGVTFVAATGDDGGIYGPDWPASSPNVVAVGGATLSASSAGTYLRETAWSGYGNGGSNGGVSAYEPLPSYQSQAFPRLASGRVTPDVSYNANPSTGFAVYDSTTYQGQSGWYQIGGTSAGAPQWSALFALANQSRLAAGESALNSASALSGLYSGAFTEYQSTPSTLFHDVTSGSNAYYQAYSGYDAVTGLGSPVANNLISYLTTGKVPGTSTTTTTTTTAGGTSSNSTSGGTTGTTSGGTTSSSTGTSTPSPTRQRHSRWYAATPATQVMVSVPATAAPNQPIVLVTLPPVTAAPAQSAPAVSTATAAPSTAVTTPALPTQPLAQPSLSVQNSQPSLSSSRVSELTTETGQDVVNEPADETPTEGSESSARAVPLSLLVSWDRGLTSFDTEAGDAVPAAKPVETAPVPADEPPSALGRTLMAGAAVAFWGAWEIRSRLGDRRQRRTFLGR